MNEFYKDAAGRIYDLEEESEAVEKRAEALLDDADAAEDESHRPPYLVYLEIATEHLNMARRNLILARQHYNSETKELVDAL